MRLEQEVRMDHAVIAEDQASRSRNDVPRDRRLPHLASLFDSETMKKRLQDHLHTTARDPSPWLIRSCEPIQVRYTPDSSCLITFRLTIEHSATSERDELVLCGRAFPPGRSRAQWRTANVRPRVTPRFGPALIHLPDVEMVLWSFPNHPLLHTLPAAIKAVHLTPTFLRDWLVSELGSGWHISDTTALVVHELGEQTCTVQISIACSHSNAHVRHTRTIFGTTYAKDTGTRTARVMRQLWNSAARRSGQFSVPQLLRYDADLKTLWHRGVHGTTLNNHPIDYLACTPVLMKVACAVAAFHSTPLTSLRSITRAQVMQRLETVGSLLLRCQPACRAVLVPLLVRLTAQATMIPARPTTTLHGKLHTNSLVLTEGTITVINLDHVGTGHPGQDLGSFIAGLLTWGVARQASLSQMASHAQLFLDQYHQAVPWKMGKPVVAWFIAFALVTEHAYQCITRLTNGRRGMVDQLLYLANDISKARSLGAVAYERTETRSRSRLL